MVLLIIILKDASGLMRGINRFMNFAFLTGVLKTVLKSGTIKIIYI